MMKYLLIFLTTLLFASPLNLLNNYRAQVGLNPLKENRYLDVAAQKHAYFMYKNNAIGHYEAIGYPYFFGNTPFDRAIKAGYPTRQVVENISHGEENFNESIKDLFSAIYHRIGFLDFNIDEIGYAKISNFYVYDMGNSVIANSCKNPSYARSGYIGMCKNRNTIISKKTYNYLISKNPKVVLWPYPNMQNTPTVFYNEIPDPLPNIDVSGYPISILFNPYYYKHIKLIDFKIDNMTYKIITKNNDVNHKLKYNQFVLFPLKRLDYDKTYYIHAKFLVDGKIKVFNWKFHTEKTNNILEVTQINQTFYIKPNIKYSIYFKPQNKKDVITGFRYRYPSTLKIKDIAFKDANTIYLKVSGYGKITLYTNNKRVNLIIKDK